MSGKRTGKKGAAAQPAPAPKKEPEPPAEEANEEEDKKKRQQMTAILGLLTAPARCAGHLRAALALPADVQKEIAAKRAEMKKDLDEDDAEKLKSEIEELSKDSVRLGGDAPIAVAKIADIIATECFKHAMDQANGAGIKTVTIGNLHAGDPTSMNVWPLIRDLPAIAKYDPEHEVELAKLAAAYNKQQKEMREAAKKAKEAGAAVPAKAAKVEADEEEGDGPSTTFSTYVDSISKELKKEEAYKNMRVSTRLREVITELIAQFIARLAVSARIAVLELVDVRILHAVHILGVLNILFTACRGQSDQEAVQEILSRVNDTVQEFRDFRAAEKERKLLEMSPEKKAELEEKKAKLEHAQKVKKAAVVKAKAMQLAHQAKALAAELKEEQV